MEKIGIVGVGAMGSALLERLRLAKVEATVSISPRLRLRRRAGREL